MCIAVSVGKEGNLLKEKKNKSELLHKSLRIRYKIFNYDNDNSGKDRPGNGYEKYYIAMFNRGFFL